MSKSTASSGGIGLSGILTILFVLLKVFGLIDWSWWWVFAPLWIPIALLCAFVVVGGIVILIGFLFFK